MRIGIFEGAAVDQGLDATVAAAVQAEADGFASCWLPQIFALDALTAFAVAGQQTERIELGTAVVPTYPRHPMALAQQALTVQAATHGRLTLGIGLSHQIVVEGVWGLSFDKPLRHATEYVEVLTALLRDRGVNFDGTTLQVHGTVTAPDVADAPPVLLAALGEKMLDLAARCTAGTATWMTGPKTLAEHTVPTLRAAAERHGTGNLRVVAALPVCVTDDPNGAREFAAQVFSVYGQLPSYRAMLDREGVAGPGDVAIVGSEQEVGDAIRALAPIGVTDFVAVDIGGDPTGPTRGLLRALASDAA
ncbi:MAG: TIGR03564 family F420-dependent LLM class oxidoreductase [Acidimicrobiia bacterium]